MAHEHLIAEYRVRITMDLGAKAEAQQRVAEAVEDIFADDIHQCADGILDDYVVDHRIPRALRDLVHVTVTEQRA